MKEKTKMKLYYHKTDGGAEYLMDKYLICPNGDKEGVFNGSSVVVRIDGNIKKDAEISLNLSEKDFILNTSEEEIFSIIESFLNRIKKDDWGFYKNDSSDFYEGNNKELIILDKAKQRIIKEMIKSFKSYKN